MNRSFIQQLGGNKQTNEMVEFSRGILHLEKYHGLKSDFIDASMKYVLSDAAAMEGIRERFQQSEIQKLLELNGSLADAKQAQARSEFWFDLEDKKNKYAHTGLYYSVALMPGNEDDTFLKNLWPAVEGYDAILKDDPKVGDNTALKLIQLYKAVLVDDNNLTPEQRDFAFDDLLIETMKSAETAKKRGVKTYGFGMTVIAHAGLLKCNIANGLTANAIFADNHKTALKNKFYNIDQVFHDMNIRMMTMGNFEKVEKTFGAAYLND